MKIRIDRPSNVRLALEAGDELILQHMTPEVRALLDGQSLDGGKHAHLVSDDGEDETAVVGATGETATTGRGRRRESRSTPVSE